MAKPAHRAYALAADVAREHGTEPVPLEPHGLMADVDVALEQQILNIPQRQRKTHVHHNHQRITAGDELKYRNGLGGFALDLRLMLARYQKRPCSATLV